MIKNQLWTPVAFETDAARKRMGLNRSTSMLGVFPKTKSPTSLAVIGVSKTPLRKCPVARIRPPKSAGPIMGK